MERKVQGWIERESRGEWRGGWRGGCRWIREWTMVGKIIAYVGWVDAQLLGGEGVELGASILTPRRALHAH